MIIAARLNLLLLFVLLCSCALNDEQQYTKMNIHGSLVCHEAGFSIKPYKLGTQDAWLETSSNGNFFFLQRNINAFNPLLQFAQNYSRKFNYLDSNSSTESSFYLNQNLIFPLQSIDFVLEKFSMTFLGITTDVFRVYTHSQTKNPDVVVVFYSSYKNLQEQFDRNASVITSFYSNQNDC